MHTCYGWTTRLKPSTIKPLYEHVHETSSKSYNDLFAFTLDLQTRDYTTMTPQHEPHITECWPHNAKDHTILVHNPFIHQRSHTIYPYAKDKATLTLNFLP